MDEIFILQNQSGEILGCYATYERAQQEIDENPHGKGDWSIHTYTVEK